MARASTARTRTTTSSSRCRSRTSSRTAPPTALQLATVTLPPTSPFYPHDAAAAAGVDGQPLNVRYRATETGNRNTTDTNKGYQLVGGIKGTIANRWDTDLSYSYAEGELHNHVNSGFPLYSRILPLLNSGNVNLFAPNTPAIQQQLRDTSFVGDAVFNKASTSAVNGKISGDLFDWRGGTVAGAIGVDLRKEKLDENPAHEYTIGDISGYGGNANPISADRKVTAFYGEINVPIVKSLELDAAIRTDDYSDFGRTNNPKFSLRWQPTRSVLFRTSYGTGFLAPSLYELDNPATSGVSPTGQSDPIRCPVTHDTGFDCGTQFATINGGNHGAAPRGERADDPWHGVRAEPHLVHLGRLLQDPPEERHHDRRPGADDPGRPGPVRSLRDARSRRSGVPHAAGPDHRHRPALSSTSAPRTSRASTASSITSGSRSPGAACASTSRAPTTRATTSRTSTASFSGIVGTALNSPVVGVIPRWKHYASLSLDSGPFTVTVAHNYQTGYTDFQTDLDGNERHVGSMSLFDLQGVYSGLKHFTFTLGVKNVFDTNPPLTNQQNTFQAGYDPSYYDARARFVYGSIRYEFR